jgi:hypothetical protein
MELPDTAAETAKNDLREIFDILDYPLIVLDYIQFFYFGSFPIPGLIFYVESVLLLC